MSCGLLNDGFRGSVFRVSACLAGCPSSARTQLAVRCAENFRHGETGEAQGQLRCEWFEGQASYCSVSIE